MGDQRLADLVPIGREFTYLTASGQITHTLAPSLTAQLEPYLGIEIEGSDPFLGVQASASWRRSPDLEIRASLGYGQAFGLQGESDNSFTFELGVILRW